MLGVFTDGGASPPRTMVLLYLIIAAGKTKK